MRYLVVGTWRVTGDEGAVFVVSDDALQAAKQAESQGLLVNWVRPIGRGRGPSEWIAAGETSATQRDP